MPGKQSQDFQYQTGGRTHFIDEAELSLDAQSPADKTQPTTNTPNEFINQDGCKTKGG